MGPPTTNQAPTGPFPVDFSTGVGLRLGVFRESTRQALKATTKSVLVRLTGLDTVRTRGPRWLRACTSSYIIDRILYPYSLPEMMLSLPLTRLPRLPICAGEKQRYTDAIGSRLTIYNESIQALKR